MPSDSVIRTRNLYVWTQVFDKQRYDSIRKSSNNRIPLPSMIDNCTGEENFAHMWQDHYNSLLNSVKGNTSKQVIYDMLGTRSSESKSILFTNSDLNNALKSLKRGKAYVLMVLPQNILFILLLFVGGGESDHPAFGPPASLSLHLTSSSITPAEAVHKSRGDSVVRMWVQLKKWWVSCVWMLQRDIVVMDVI